MFISQKNSQKYLLIFDFDGTIIDKDSEEELLKNVFPEEELNNVMNKIYNLDFFEGFNYYFKLMKDLGLTLGDINTILEKIELSPKITELFNFLRKNKSNYEIIICSTGIDYSIKYILKYHGFLDLIDDFICPKSIEKSEQLLYVPKNQFPHECDICAPSQCKGTELKKYLLKNNKNYEKILFVCDGGNDYCPSKNFLKKGDIVFPRFGNSLYKKLFEENFKNELICEICPWKSADEIILKLQGL